MNTSKSEDAPPEPQSLHSLLTAVHDLCAEGPPTLAEVLDAAGSRSLGSVLVIPALIAVMPGIGALPGISWTMAALILILSGQFFLHREAVWLPRRLRRVRISPKFLELGIAGVRPFVRLMDRISRPRLSFLTSAFFTHVTALVCIFLGFVMYAVSFVPGGVVVPAFAVAILGIGLTAQDGAIVLVGLLATIASAAFAVWLIV